MLNEYDESMSQYRYLLESEKYKNYMINNVKTGLSYITIHHCYCGYLIRNMKYYKNE